MLKPGGLAAFVEWDFQAYDIDCKPIGSEEGSCSSWIAKFLSTCRKAMTDRGADLGAINNLERWCSEENHAFDSTMPTVYWLPCSSWCELSGPDGDNQRKLGAEMASNYSVRYRLHALQQVDVHVH